MAINSDSSLKFCRSALDARRWNRRDTFIDADILSENLSLFHMRKKSKYISNNVLVSAYILDVSKLMLYRRFYELKEYFKDRLGLCSIEVDSFVLIVRDPGNTFVQDMRKFKHLFDFSSLSEKHPLYSIENKGKEACLKFELSFIAEYIKIRTKSMALLSLCPCKASLLDSVTMTKPGIGKQMFEENNGKGPKLPKRKRKSTMSQISRNLITPSTSGSFLRTALATPKRKPYTQPQIQPSFTQPHIEPISPPSPPLPNPQPPTQPPTQPTTQPTTNTTKPLMHITACMGCVITFNACVLECTKNLSSVPTLYEIVPAYDRFTREYEKCPCHLRLANSVSPLADLTDLQSLIEKQDFTAPITP
ncbi:unnamed protein product [Orchesella dallaii]|uniref:Uncharacterized protein n=1 Tax=Orchesella dallaii TaxID=48710 RepID=A0ABP1RLW1_9HEXA